MEKAIVFTPTDKQNEAHELLENNRIVLYGGAIRGAKSYWGCLEIITFCFKYPNSRWLMLRETLPTIKNTLLKTFQENFLNKGFNRYVKSFNQQSLILTWNNDSQIIFMAEGFDTDKELNRFRGLEINGAFIDEVNEIQEVTFDKVVERAGSWFHSVGCPTKILMSCNPSNNWVKRRFYDKHEAGTLPEGQAYIQARITDNPYIPADYMESLKMLPRYQYMAFVEGDWNVSIKIGGEFYKCFELDTHVGQTKYNPLLPLHISFDDNSNPYLPCGIFQITGKHVMMIDEIMGVNPNNTISSVCREFERRYPIHAAGLFIYGDATADKQDTKLEKGYRFYRLIQDALSRYKPSLRVASSNASVVMRGNWINTVFEKELHGVKVTIGEQCKTAILDFVQLKEAADGTKNKEMETDPKTKVRYQKYGHFSDLFDYLMTTAFAAEFMNYQRGDVVMSITAGKNFAKNSF